MFEHSRGKLSGYWWWNSVLEVIHWQKLSLRYGNNDDRLRIEKRLDWVFFHSGCKYVYQRLLHAINNFPSQCDEDFYNHLHQKHLDVPFWQIYQYLKLSLLPVLYCTTTVVFHSHALHFQHQCCIATCVDSLKYCFVCW